MTPRKTLIIFALIILVVAGVWLRLAKSKDQAPNDAIRAPLSAAQTSSSTPTQSTSSSSPSLSLSLPQPAPIIPPLADAFSRVTKKPFGIFITPTNSPVQPKRFRGYHTGTDFETFPDEQNIDVPVSAICNGTLVMKKRATGYGGVAVEQCSINGETVTVVYGHVKLESVTPNVGDAMKAGEPFAILGKGFSAETDGERKHLHLGIHKGTSINILGYVQKKSGLSQWIDAVTVLRAR